MDTRTQADLLVSAFEGGSNYWYVIVDDVLPEVNAKPWGDEYTPSYISYPFSKGGAVIIADAEEVEQDPDTGEMMIAETFRLDKKAIAKGTVIFKDKYPEHYADTLVESQADAETGDVFLQCCLFGEVIYG